MQYIQVKVPKKQGGPTRYSATELKISSSFVTSAHERRHLALYPPPDHSIPAPFSTKRTVGGH